MGDERNCGNCDKHVKQAEISKREVLATPTKPPRLNSRHHRPKKSRHLAVPGFKPWLL